MIVHVDPDGLDGALRPPPRDASPFHGAARHACRAAALQASPATAPVVSAAPDQRVTDTLEATVERRPVSSTRIDAPSSLRGEPPLPSRSAAGDRTPPRTMGQAFGRWLMTAGAVLTLGVTALLWWEPVPTHASPQLIASSRYEPPQPALRSRAARPNPYASRIAPVPLVPLVGQPPESSTGGDIPAARERALPPKENASSPAAPTRSAPAPLEHVFPGRFDLGSIHAIDVDEVRLRTLVRELARGCGDAEVEVTGHTCSAGRADTNHRVGLLRAQQVRRLLILNGLPAARVRAASAGGTHPLASNETLQGRLQNRRVTIRCATPTEAR